MTELLDHAIEIAKTLPASTQDEIAQMILEAAAAASEPWEPLSEEEEASFDESIAQEERGEFASEDEVRAFRAKV